MCSGEKTTMEILGIVDCPLWILLLLGIIASVVLYSKWKQNVLRTLGLPGPKPALFFGIFPMYKQKGIALTDLELVKKYGKVVGIYHGNTPNILIADPEMIEEICVKKFSNFQNRSSVLDLGCLLQRSVALSQGSKWVDLRAKLVSVFSCSNIKQTTDLLHECIDNLMIKIEDNSETSIDISVFCRNYSMDAISKLVFGLSINTHDDPNNEMARMAHKAWVAGTSDVVGKSTICAMFPVFKHLFRSMNYTPLPNEVVEYFTKISKIGIHDRKKELSESKDLLNCMIKCHVNNGYTNKDNRAEMDEDDILANCLFFILAGYDTTANALAFLLYCLATNEKWQQRLTDEIDETFQKKTPSYDVMDLPCLDMIMSETFRLYPPFLRFNRTADSSTCVQGQTIPKGMDVFFPVYAIHRHPDLWEEPDVFNPERFSSSNKEKHRYSYIPFGCGKRNCFGMELALLEVKLAAVKILQEYTVTTTSETQIPPSFEKSGFLRPQNGIYLKFFPR